MGGGGDGQQSTTTTTTPTIPSWLAPLYQNTAANWIAAQGGLPGMEALYQSMPLLGIPPLNSAQLTAIGGFEGIPTGSGTAALNPIQQLALQDYGAFFPSTNGSVGVGGVGAGGAGGAGLPAITQPAERFGPTGAVVPDGGSTGSGASTGAASPAMAPAYAAAQNEFNTLTLPTIENAMALSGGGNSGALGEALATGEAQTLLPLMEQQAQSQLQATGAIGALGATAYQQQIENLSNSLQAAGLPYEVAQQQAQAYYNQEMMRQQYAAQIQQGPAQQFGNLIGGSSASNVNVSGPKM